MRLLNDLLPDSLLQALGWTLVHSLWQLVLIAALLWGILKLVHRSKPAVKYILAVGALVLAVLMGVSTFVYEINEAKNNAAFSADDFQNLVTAPLFSSNAVGMEATTVTITRWINQYIPFLVNIWFLGSLLFLFRLGNSLSEIRGLRKSSTPVSDFQLEKIAYRLAGKIGVKTDVQLRISQFGISPLTFGTLRPIILLPAGLIFQLSPTQLEAIIAHELAHVKRHDYLINMVLSGLEVIFFYHPCYWWMNQTVKELRENAADDLAIKAGVEPKNLATGLAEVLNFARQNPPELALAAGKKRNPTLLRIKRMLGYQTENYPQTPIISIPMLLTLVLSLGLMASAQQDAPKPLIKPALSPLTKPTALPITSADTTKRSENGQDVSEFFFSEKNEMVISDGKNSYRISGDKLFTEDGFVILSAKTKLALEELKKGSYAPLPEFEYPEAPEFFGDEDMPEFPEVDWEFPAMDFEAIPAFPMEALPPFPMDPLAALSPLEPMDFPLEGFEAFGFFNDTLKLTPAEQEKIAKELAKRSEKWSKIAEENAAGLAKRSEEWAAKWQEGEAERNEKIEAWKKEFEPKMKEFELKMQEWQKAQEPKLKEFELKMKEWETTQQPKMEEFQRKMEVWQKEQQSKIQEFQKLLQEELKKDNN
jgi:beta-lactamase regulating signal transducer with metallopeptidase domain